MPHAAHCDAPSSSRICLRLAWKSLERDHGRYCRSSRGLDDPIQAETSAPLSSLHHKMWQKIGVASRLDVLTLHSQPTVLLFVLLRSCVLGSEDKSLGAKKGHEWWTTDLACPRCIARSRQLHPTLRSSHKTHVSPFLGLSVIFRILPQSPGAFNAVRARKHNSYSPFSFALAAGNQWCPHHMNVVLSKQADITRSAGMSSLAEFSFVSAVSVIS